MRTKKDMVEEIAKDTFLSRNVVEDVINRYTDILIDEIVNEGNVKIPRLFSVTSRVWKSNLQAQGKPRRRLTVRMNRRLRELFKRFGPDSNLFGYLNKDNWRLLQESKVSDLPKEENNQKIYNPILDDDDDEEY